MGLGYGMKIKIEQGGYKIMETGIIQRFYGVYRINYLPDSCRKLKNRGNGIPVILPPFHGKRHSSLYPYQSQSNPTFLPNPLVRNIQIYPHVPDQRIPFPEAAVCTKAKHSSKKIPTIRYSPSQSIPFSLQRQTHNAG